MKLILVAAGAEILAYILVYILALKGRLWN